MIWKFLLCVACIDYVLALYAAKHGQLGGALAIMAIVILQVVAAAHIKNRSKSR